MECRSSIDVEDKKCRGDGQEGVFIEGGEIIIDGNYSMFMDVVVDVLFRVVFSQIIVCFEVRLEIEQLVF